MLEGGVFFTVNDLLPVIPEAEAQPKLSGTFHCRLGSLFARPRAGRDDEVVVTAENLRATDDLTKECCVKRVRIMRRYDTPIGMRPVPGTLLKQFAIYILTNRPRGVLYVGMSSWLAERIRQHREGLIPGFTQRYRLNRVVYFEYLDSAALAIAREKRLKRWHREWKIELIERMNPTWRDLWPDITGP